MIAVSSTFAAAPLIRGGLQLDLDTLTIVILIIQFTAFFGALLLGPARRLDRVQAIDPHQPGDLVGGRDLRVLRHEGRESSARVCPAGRRDRTGLGGSQAISRSLFAQMIPSGREAEFYSFYEVSDRGTSWLGPALFAFTNQMFGSLRPAILSLIVFFVAGLIALPFVNVRKGIEDVKRETGSAT